MEVRYDLPDFRRRMLAAERRSGNQIFAHRQSPDDDGVGHERLTISPLISEPGLVGTVVAGLGNGRRRGDSNRMISNSPISGAQLRAARALLKWSVRELSDRCRVSRSAISRSERVDGTLAMQMRNLNAIRRTFEEHGIEFLGLDGVRLLPRSSKD
jgi:hypothetical protein